MMTSARVARWFVAVTARVIAVAVATAMLPTLLCATAEARTVQLMAPAGGQVRALLVGVNDYTARSIPTLKGAVADAIDLEKTLRAAGVTDLTALIDQRDPQKPRPPEATRRNFEAAINKLIANARQGDLVIIAFAGHGSQQRELVKGSEPDGMDEIFLLTGFESAGPGTAERLIDDEINHWLLQFAKKKVEVLFIADTCHGGGMMRAPDFRSGQPSYRFVDIPMAPQNDKLTPVSMPSDAKLTADDLPDVTFLAAVNKVSKAPEVTVPDNKTLRGALSYAVARSIEKGQDGALTRQQLFGFARQLTYQYSETKQTITTEPAGTGAKLDKVVFRLKVINDSAEAPRSEAMRLKVINGDAKAMSGIGPGQSPFQLVKESEDSDIVWDVAKGDVLNGYGDVVAKTTRAADIPAMVDAVGAKLAISKLSETGGPQSMKLLPNDGRFRRGEVVRFHIDGLTGKYLILVNLSGNGRVRYLYPLLKDDAALIVQPTFDLPLRVEEPFGADHLIAIVSDARLPQTEAAIRALDDQKAAGKFVDILRSVQSSDRSVRIGMAGLFTTE